MGHLISFFKVSFLDTNSFFRKFFKTPSNVQAGVQANIHGQLQALPPLQAAVQTLAQSPAPTPAPAPVSKLATVVAFPTGVDFKPISVRLAAPTLPSYLDEEEQAKRILAITVARQATRFVSHVSVSRVSLTPSQIKEGMKGKIVGKDGRNARAFEEKAGVDLLLNDEPNSVMISSFDPFRREVARVALETLVRDGRIQVARIEECLTQAKSEVDQKVRETGQKAALELGISQLHPAILRVLGTLKFRHSFGQNQLEHSVETAALCGGLAAELGLDVALAKRAGLLHDLGKALDQTHDSGHAGAGAEFAKRYGESSEVVHAIAAHHEEVPADTWLDHLVIAADALSGARPGARNGSTLNGLERATALEKIALEVAGVRQACAVQAGREVRVFVDSSQVLDGEVTRVAREIADRIQAEVRFPGQIQVTVLREQRAVEIATSARGVLK